MADIYGNTYFVLAADLASESNTGFLTERRTQDYVLNGKPDDLEELSAQNLAGSHNAPLFVDIESSDFRAHHAQFHQGVKYDYSKHDPAAEAGAFKNVFWGRLCCNERQGFDLPLKIGLGSFQPRSVSLEQATGIWWNLVDLYSARALTFANGRLPAIWGLARKMPPAACCVSKDPWWKVSYTRKLVDDSRRLYGSKAPTPTSVEGPTQRPIYLDEPSPLSKSVDSSKQATALKCFIIQETNHKYWEDTWTSRTASTLVLRPSVRQPQHHERVGIANVTLDEDSSHELSIEDHVLGIIWSGWCIDSSPHAPHIDRAAARGPAFPSPAFIGKPSTCNSPCKNQQLEATNPSSHLRTPYIVSNPLENRSQLPTAL